MDTKQKSFYKNNHKNYLIILSHYITMHSHSHAHSHQSTNKKFLSISLILSIFLALAKSIIGFFIGSPALIASSIDSTMDAFSTSINRFILNISSKPADFEHPFGHGKFEAFSGLLQGIFVTITSLSLLLYSVIQIFQNTLPTEDLENASSAFVILQDFQILGILIIVISIITPLLLSYYMKKQAEKSKSLILEAEHSHFYADGLMNSGVLIGLLFSYFYNIYWIDSIIGIGIALWLIWNIKDLIIESFNVLTDKKLPCTIIKTLTTILDEEKKNTDTNSIKGWHDLQTRRSGSEYHINIHLEFEDTTSLLNAHKQSDIIEEKIKKNYQNAIILTHFDLHSEYLSTDICMK